MGERLSVQVVLFDIDGTLISSGGSSDRAWRRAFKELQGVDIDIGQVTGRGVPDPEVGIEGFRIAVGREPEKGEMDALMAKRLEYLPEEVENSERYRVMPGVPAILERLEGEGIKLGLTTGNVEPAAHIKLARADLNRFFSFGGYGSDSSDRTELTKKALERAAEALGEPVETDACLGSGDTPRDVEAGHGAGIRVVGVATGEYTVRQLREAGAEFAIETLEEFPI